MPPRTSGRLVALLLGVALASCAGYRGGWESVPYVGDAPPPLQVSRTSYEAYARTQLQFPGITLGVMLQNRMRDYDRQVYFYVLPVPGDSREQPTQRIDAGMTRVSLRVSGTDGDYVFQPLRARLSVGGVTVAATGAREFGMWDERGRPVSSAGRWGDQVIEGEHSLDDRKRTYLLSLDFPVASPSPERTDIVLDLSEALRANGRPALPPIRFAPTRWREGYT